VIIYYRETVVKYLEGKKAEGVITPPTVAAPQGFNPTYKAALEPETGEASQGS